MENLSLTKNLVLTPSGSFELDGVPVSKADAVEHYLAVEPLAGWPLAVEVSLLQDRLDTLEAEAGPLDEVLAEAAERAAAARQAHREWYEKESGEIAARSFTKPQRTPSIGRRKAGPGNLSRLSKRSPS